MPWLSLERLVEKRLRALVGDGFAELPPEQRLDALKLGIQWTKMKRATEQGSTYGSFFREPGEDADRDNDRH